MLTVIHIRSLHLMSATHQLCCTKLNSNENDQSNILLICFEYIYIYILSQAGQEDETFKNKWNGILRECSLNLMECLVEHYERQIAHNVVKIAESYEH